MWHGQGDVLVSVLAPENIFRPHVFFYVFSFHTVCKLRFLFRFIFPFMNMISASAYAFWFSHIVLWFMFQLMDLIFNLSICYLVFEYGHVLWSYRLFRYMILELVMFSGWAFCHVLQYTTFHGMSSFFIFCHVPSRVWVSKLCKRLVLCFTLHVLHILLCLCSQLCYRFSRLCYSATYITCIPSLIKYQVWGTFIAIITSIR